MDEEKTKTFDDYNDIECPHCNENQHYEICDGALSESITYWGEGGPIEYECKYCDKKFFIKECVIRDFEVGKVEEDF